MDANKASLLSMISAEIDELLVSAVTNTSNYTQLMSGAVNRALTKWIQRSTIANCAAAFDGSFVSLYSDTVVTGEE